MKKMTLFVFLFLLIPSVLFAVDYTSAEKQALDINGFVRKVCDVDVVMGSSINLESNGIGSSGAGISFATWTMLCNYFPVTVKISHDRMALVTNVAQTFDYYLWVVASDISGTPTKILAEGSPEISLEVEYLTPANPDPLQYTARTGTFYFQLKTTDASGIPGGVYSSNIIFTVVGN